MLRLAKTNDKLSIVSDQKGAPTSAKSIARAIFTIIDFISNNKRFNSGIYNFSGKPHMSWFDFARDIFKRSNNLRILEKDLTLIPILTSEFKFKAPRPLNSSLNNNKILKFFSITPDNYSKSLDEVLDEIKNISANKS